MSVKHHVRYELALVDYTLMLWKWVVENTPKDKIELINSEHPLEKQRIKTLELAKLCK